MTDEEILSKSDCLKELNVFSSINVGQFFSITMSNGWGTNYTIRIKEGCQGMSSSEIIANSVFRTALKRALEDYKVALRQEIDK